MAWSDVKAGGNNNSGGDKKEIKYATLTPGGAYQLRALDEEPYSRWSHWIQTANAGKGLSIDCIGSGCPVCDARKTEEGKKRYGVRKLHAMNFIQRNLGADGKPIPGDVGEVVILDKGNQLYESLAGLLEEVGDLRGYDIKMRVAGDTMKPSYTPIPMIQKPLTKEEQALEKYDFEQIYKKFTPDQIVTLMNGGTLKDVLTSDNDEAQPDVDFTKK